MIKIAIKNSGTFCVKKGTLLIDLLTRKTAPIPAMCGGQGRCGQCRVKIEKDSQPLDHIETIFISEPLAEQGYHLACRFRLEKDTIVTLPTKSKTTPRMQKNGGLALDLGTTVIKGALVDLQKKKIIKTARTLNLQSTMGGDVITRIGMALRGKYTALCAQLNRSITTCMNQLGLQRPVFTAVAGNSVMLSFYLKQPVDGFAAHPFQGSLDKGILTSDPPGYAFPVIGSFVGGDIIAGILARNIDKSKKNIMYADLGTNGEVALVTPERIFAASTAAGPAFEGVGIPCGSLAVPGAIKKTGYTRGKFTFETIDKARPIGICASGLIDTLYAAVEHDFISDSGRLNKPLSVGQFNINQHDIRRLQLSVGAIHTGMKILMKKSGLSSSDLDEIIITGEFGRTLNQVALKRIGLIPSGDHRIRTIKDLALKGTVMVLLDDRMRERVDEIKRKCIHVDLATHPDFQAEFVEAMRFSPWE